MTAQKELLLNYENLDLERLPEVLPKKGFTYTLIKRTNGKCLYKQVTDGAIVAYEVFKTKIAKHRENIRRHALREGQEFDESKYAEYKEAFPNDEEFGKRAWSYKSLESALASFEDL